MVSILVTGFGPFPGVARNPSASLAQRVAESAAMRRIGIRATHLILTTSYAALEQELAPALHREMPDCLLMLGVAARRKRICVEARAANRASVMFPDAQGQLARGYALRAGGTSARRPRIAMQPLLRALAGQGVRPKLSRDAGRYLCNAAYYEALGIMGHRPVVFLHVPMPSKRARPSHRPDPRPDLVEMQAAIQRAARVLAVRSRLR